MKNNVDQDQRQILAEHDGTAFGNRYVYGNYIDEVLVMNDGTDDRYYAHDHLYSPAALLDDTGAVVERYEYDAYGKAAILTPDSWLPTSPQYANPFTFTGRQLDILDNGNLHHMHYRHRDYSPQLGRFMQHDPIDLLYLQKFAGISVVPNHITVKIMVGYSYENMAEWSGWINFSRLVSIYRRVASARTKMITKSEKSF